MFAPIQVELFAPIATSKGPLGSVCLVHLTVEQTLTLEEKGEAKTPRQRMTRLWEELLLRLRTPDGERVQVTQSMGETLDPVMNQLLEARNAMLQEVPSFRGAAKGAAGAATVGDGADA